MTSATKRPRRDPLTEAATLNKAATLWQREADALRALRNDAIRAAVEAGHTQKAVADAVELSPPLVRRILQGDDQ